MARPDEVPHGHLHGKVCRLLVDCPNAERFTGRHGPDGPVMEPTPYKVGQLVKVVMVSRFGDCGITDDLDAVNGYGARVLPEQLEVHASQPVPLDDTPRAPAWRGTLLPTSPRYASWMKVFGTDTVPLERPWPTLGYPPDGGEAREFFKVDVRTLTAEQMDRLVEHLRATFGMSSDELREGLLDPAHGLPILAQDVVVAIPLRHVL